jgi:oxygen-dependent protoporphyrinogen oxidase
LKLLVVGGGITGLAGALEAARAGIEVTLVEAGDRLGGKVWTERVDTLVIEHGPDSVINYRPEALALARELQLGESIEEIASSRVVYMRSGGKLRPLPASMGIILPARLWPFVTTGILSIPDKLRAGFDLVLPRRLKVGEDQSIGEFLKYRLGPAMVRKFADPLVGGIYGASVDDLSLDAVLPSLRQSEEEHRALLLAARAGRPRGKQTKASSPFRSLAGGMGTLIDALGEALDHAGVEIVTSQHVDSGVLSSSEYDHVLLAGGVGSTKELLADHVPEAVALLEKTPLSSSTVVTLAYSDDQVGSGKASHGWLEAQVAPVSGITVSSAKWAGRAPAGTTLIRAFVPARLGAIATVGDQELLEAVRSHLGEVMGVRGEPSLTRITRWKNVMPTYTVGHLDRVAAIEKSLEPTPWRLAGSALHGVGLPDCISSARRIVQSWKGLES